MSKEVELSNEAITTIKKLAAEAFWAELKLLWKTFYAIMAALGLASLTAVGGCVYSLTTGLHAQVKTAVDNEISNVIPSKLAETATETARKSIDVATKMQYDAEELAKKTTESTRQTNNALEEARITLQRVDRDVIDATARSKKAQATIDSLQKSIEALQGQYATLADADQKNILKKASDIVTAFNGVEDGAGAKFLAELMKEVTIERQADATTHLTLNSTDVILKGHLGVGVGLTVEKNLLVRGDSVASGRIVSAGDIEVLGDFRLDGDFSKFKSSVTGSGDSVDGYLTIGPTLMCWGRRKLDLPSDPNNRNAREFEFTFAKPFAETPVVSDAILTSGSPNSFGVYRWAATPRRFWGAVINHPAMERTNVPVIMQYIAIGRSDGQSAK